MHALLRGALHQRVFDAARDVMAIESIRLRDWELRAVRHDKIRVLSSSYLAWKKRLRDARHHTHILKHGMGYRRRLTTRLVMCEWRRVATRKHFARRRLRGALTIVQRRMTRNALRIWHTHASGSKRRGSQRRLLCRAKERRAKRSISRAFSAWRRHILDIQKDRTLVRALILLNISKRWSRLQTTPCFQKWKHCVAYHRKQETVILRQNALRQRVRCRMVKNVSYRALNAWIQYVAERKRSRRLLLHVMRRFQRNSKVRILLYMSS